MRFKIDLREPRHIGGPDRISERLLIATFWIGGGRQVNPVAICAGHPRSTLKARIELVRAGRLTEIKSPGADVNGNNDLMILSRNTAGEERARNCGGAKDGPAPQDSCLEGPVRPWRRRSWTPLNGDDGCRRRSGTGRLGSGRKFWLPILSWGTHIQGEGNFMRRGGCG